MTSLTRNALENALIILLERAEKYQSPRDITSARRINEILMQKGSFDNGCVDTLCDFCDVAIDG